MAQDQQGIVEPLVNGGFQLFAQGFEEALRFFLGRIAAHQVVHLQWKGHPLALQFLAQPHIGRQVRPGQVRALQFRHGSGHPFLRHGRKRIARAVQSFEVLDEPRQGFQQELQPQLDGTQVVGKILFAQACVIRPFMGGDEGQLPIGGLHVIGQGFHPALSLGAQTGHVFGEDFLHQLLAFSREPLQVQVGGDLLEEVLARLIGVAFMVDPDHPGMGFQRGFQCRTGVGQFAEQGHLFRQTHRGRSLSPFHILPVRFQGEYLLAQKQVAIQPGQQGAQHIEQGLGGLDPLGQDQPHVVAAVHRIVAEGGGRQPQPGGQGPLVGGVGLRGIKGNAQIRPPQQHPLPGGEGHQLGQPVAQQSLHLAGNFPVKAQGAGHPGAVENGLDGNGSGDAPSHACQGGAFPGLPLPVMAVQLAGKALLLFRREALVQQGLEFRLPGRKRSFLIGRNDAVRFHGHLDGVPGNAFPAR